jgi:hypothetical protein
MPNWLQAGQAALSSSLLARQTAMSSFSSAPARAA